MIVFLMFAGYIITSVILYFILRAKCKKNAVFRLTWGLPSVFVGAVIALFVRLTGHRAKPYGWEWCFEIPNIGWGLELGLFFIAPSEYEITHMHEHGHGIQNIYLGIFNPLVVFLPSVMRFWYRKIREKIGRPCKTYYDNIWFEHSATVSGKEFIKRQRNEQK